MYQFLLFYYGLLACGVQTAPVNKISFIHAFLSVGLITLGMDTAAIYNSIAYFVVDTWISWMSVWTFHHIMSIFVIIVQGILQKDMKAFCVSMLYMAEIGGLLYHASRYAHQTPSLSWSLKRTARQIFLVVYSSTRIYGVVKVGVELLKVFQDGDILRAVSSGVMTLVIVMNWWFVFKQYQIYKKDFISHLKV